MKHHIIEWGWFAFLMLAASVYAVATNNDLFSSSVLLSGTACVALIAMGRRAGYLIGLYNSGAYAWIAWQNGLFGEVGLNLAFYLPTGIIGFIMWSRRMTEDHVVQMRALTWRGRAITAALCVAATGLLGVALSRIDGQNTPYVDAATNVLSVIATFLMMWRFKEQWALYFALNVLTIIMWVLRYLDGGANGDSMIVMWSLFLANSMFGWWRWSRGSRQQSPQGAIQ